MEVINSVAVLLVTAIAGFLVTRLVLNRLRAARVVWLFIALLWIAFVIGILVVDVNIPLATSQYSYGGAPAPVPLVILVMFINFAVLALVVPGQSKFRSAFPR